MNWDLIGKILRKLYDCYFTLLKTLTLLGNGHTCVRVRQIRIPLLFKQSKMFTSFGDSRQSGLEGSFATSYIFNKI